MNIVNPINKQIKKTAMHKIILILLTSPMFALSQNTSVFIRLNDAAGQQIKGESVTRGFEKYIQATSTGAAGKNNTQFNFTMTVSGAAADLKKMMATDQLLSTAEVVAVVPNGGGAPVVSYTIKMEQVKVLSCSEGMGCNGAMNTTVALQATRIGWTYYTQNPKGGASTVSRKFGWDSSTNAAWTNF
jgi:type VI protein secretion system component Hcp